MKKLVSLIMIMAILAVFVPTAFAAPPAQKGQDYIVLAGDWLAKIANKYLGNPYAWPAIMALTNQKHLTDSTYATIINADLIEPGWKLYVPSKDEAEAFLATYDKNKPEMLYAKGAKGQLVVGSWWTAGGEAEGLNGMFKIYKAKYPDVQIVNATVAGGAGTNFKAILKTRLIGGDPPDTFQLHAGLEVEGYSPEQYLEPVDAIYASEGLEKVFPADLLSLLKYKDHYWGVPVNIHRSNVLWYNKKVFEANNLTPPTTFEEFKTVAEALKAKGITPFVLGTKDGWEAGHIFEDVLAGTLGAEKYKGLWTGATPWTDPGVTQALENFKMMLSYANPDHSAHTWDSAGEYLIAGTGGMMIMGDWTNGWFTSKGFDGYGWAPPPGTKGIFVALSDSFALPKNAPNAENAQNWLKVCGSKEGQEAFNPQKGSICARTDCDPTLFNEYLQSAMKDWAVDAIVPSVVHGAAAYESWVTDYKDVITLFVANKDVAAAQAGLQQACVDAGICK
ncbi:MAG: extracellular solute-binding protein [Anaerolineae bacterium]|jgi:glucose/mannose transport system substrate-binding protein|nr:extracellular solute-binding protein [Anaerolineae bacterium]MDH7474822.1 extracellular solute-binding protein [Anaerolineae bacterium]